VVARLKKGENYEQQATSSTAILRAAQSKKEERGRAGKSDCSIRNPSVERRKEGNIYLKEAPQR